MSFVFFLAWAEAAVTAIDDNNSWWHKNPVLWLIFLNTIFAFVPLANVKSVAKSIIFFWLCYFFVDASLRGFPLFRPGQLNNNSLKTLPSINITHLRHSRSMHNHLSALNTVKEARTARNSTALTHYTTSQGRPLRTAEPDFLFFIFRSPRNGSTTGGGVISRTDVLWNTYCFEGRPRSYAYSWPCVGVINC